MDVEGAAMVIQMGRVAWATTEETLRATRKVAVLRTMGTYSDAYDVAREEVCRNTEEAAEAAIWRPVYGLRGMVETLGRRAGGGA